MKRFISCIAAGLALIAVSAAQARLSENASWVQEGIASWYGAEFEGKPTASGEIFSTAQFTAAHPTLPFGTVLKITNKNNGKTVLVRVNDRGPFVAARIIDLSRAAAQQLDMIKTGTAPVLVEALPAIAAGSVPAAAAELPPVPVNALPQDNETVVQAQNGSAQPPAVSEPESGYTPPAPAVPETAAVPQGQPASPYPPQPWQPPARAAAQLKGSVPSGTINNAKTYRIQVGAYIQPKNAVDTFEKLKNAGLNPAYEKYNDFYRVVIAGVKSGELRDIAEKLGQAGFREAIVKEE